MHVVIIGLTGGIASGKTLISTYLQELGAVVIDADKLSRQVVSPGSPALKDIRDYFGNAVIDQNGLLNRKELAKIIFGSDSAREKLNSIIHPRILELIQKRIKEYKESGQVLVVIIDAPLLIEAGMTAMVNQVWVVAVSPEEQLRRLMKRDNLTKEEALDRLKSQMPLSEKIKHADLVIDNSGDKEVTLRSVHAIWKELIEGQV